MTERTQDSRPRGARRGNLVLLAAGLLALIGATAFTVDIGYLYASQTEIQASLDAAALAGVGYYDMTEEGVELAKAKAIEYAGMHEIMREPLELPEDAISTGFIAEDGSFVTSSDPKEIVAMRIDHTKVDIPVWFADVAFGRTSLSARAVSIATRGSDRSGGRVECFLPLALPACVFDDTALYQNLELKLNSATNDNVGWADLTGNPTPGAIGTTLDDICGRGEPVVGDDVFVNNGVMSSALMQLSNILNGTTSTETDAWDEDHWGPMPAAMEDSSVDPAAYGNNVLEGPVIIFESHGTPCLSAEKFNQTSEIVGFSWAVLYDVQDSGGDKNIRVRVDLETPFPGGNAGGGQGTNVMATGIALLVE